MEIEYKRSEMTPFANVTLVSSYQYLGLKFLHTYFCYIQCMQNVIQIQNSTLSRMVCFIMIVIKMIVFE